MVTIGGYVFEGGYPLNNTRFNEVEAVYVVYTNDVWLDVGETDKLASRLEGHERRDCWVRNASEKTIYVAVLQETNPQKRLLIESYLRNLFGFKCGEK